MREISPLRYRWPVPAKIFFFFLTIATLAAPIPYVFFKPGIPNDVTGKLITIERAESFPPNGKLYITSILVTNPESPVFGAETLLNWATGPNAVLPRESVYPPASNDRQIQRDSRDEMATSRITATAAALNYLGYEIKEDYVVSRVRDYSDAIGKLEVGDVIRVVNGKTIKEIEEIRDAYKGKSIGDLIPVEIERNIDGQLRKIIVNVKLTKNIGGNNGPAIGILVGTNAEFPIDVKFRLRGVGGPSAGLVFALGIVEKLTAEDLLRGRSIAGTGTISPRGRVGAIGGIEEKMIGASRKGATIFLAPAENCVDIRHVPKGLQVIPVTSLTEAITYLRAPASFKFPTCATLDNLAS
ncbi:MAG: PDZ domain-containing protein [Actinomycetales bacterium]